MDQSELSYGCSVRQPDNYHLREETAYLQSISSANLCLLAAFVPIAIASAAIP
jgi:hypothetical protein